MDSGVTRTLPKGRLSAEEISLARRLRAAMPALLPSPTPTAVVLLDGRTLLANHALAHLTGFGLDEIVGVDFAVLVPAHERGDAHSPLSLVSGAPDRFSVGPDTFGSRRTIARRDGHNLDVHATSILLRDSTGRPVALLSRLVPTNPPQAAAIWADRLEAADAEVLAAAISDQPDLDHLAEPSSISSARGVLLWVNVAFTQAFGWDNRDVVGLPEAELLVPELHGWAEQRLEGIIGAPLVPSPSTLRMRHRDGSAADVLSSPLPVRDEAGQVRYVVTTIVPVPAPSQEG